MDNKTFTMIKPCAVKNGHIGAILAKINEAGFRIVAMRMTRLSVSQAFLTIWLNLCHRGQLLLLF